MINWLFTSISSCSAVFAKHTKLYGPVSFVSTKILTLFVSLCVYWMKDTQPLSASDCPSLSLMGEQPLFEMVALAAHVRPTLSIARNDSVAGDDEWNLAEEEEQRKVNSTENNSNIMKDHFYTERQRMLVFFASSR